MTQIYLIGSLTSCRSPSLFCPDWICIYSMSFFPLQIRKTQREREPFYGKKAERDGGKQFLLFFNFVFQVKIRFAYFFRFEKRERKKRTRRIFFQPKIWYNGKQWPLVINYLFCKSLIFDLCAPFPTVSD